MTRLGRYEILEEIGRGGFAVVYRARDTELDRVVALKVIHSVSASEDALVQRFQREARTAANLRHPNVVPVYDFGDVDGRLYLAMALIGEGLTLRDLLAEGGRLSLEQALPLLAQLADVLDYLHRRDPPLTHRDVKPANVLLGGEADNPWVVLTDFGLVRSLQASAELTSSGTILGSPAYMAPEQADPERWGEITPLTDVYGLGVVTYEMLTGRVPFEGGAVTVLHAHVYDMPPSPLELVSDLGDDLSAALLCALAKPPAERPPSAGAFVSVLQEVADARVAAAEQEASLEQLEAQARELLEAGDWLEALDCCTQIVRLDPDRPAALEMLTTAKEGLDRERSEAVERRRLEERYTEGLQLLEEAKWKQAMTALEQVAAGNPDFREVQEKLTRARDELQCAQWYDEAIAHGEAGHWAEACRTWVNLLRGRLGYRDGDGARRLLDAAEGLLSQYERTYEGLALYDSLVAAVEERDWGRAVEVGEGLLQLAPDLDRSQAWLARARAELQRQEALGEDRIVWERDGKEMVRISAGVFLCGDGKEKRELPEFWMDRTPVTDAEYKRFLDANPKHPVPFVDEDWGRPYNWDRDSRSFPQNKADHPVVLVSWHDAVAYAEWAGKRLPTEEEWEKAARGTDGHEFPWGSGRPTPKLCNFGRIEGSTTSVGKYSPQGDSPYGCVDMAGNVWEWTSSDYDTDTKVLRGGGWGAMGGVVGGTSRNNVTPDSRDFSVGFRCAGEPGE
jgi:tetratricopeptide (TPR) repeat protein